MNAGRSMRGSYFVPRLLLCALAVALPLLALHAYTLYREAEDTREAAVATVAARSQDAAKEIDALLGRTERMLALLAARSELQDLDSARCSDLMKGLTTIDPMLANVGAVDVDGRPLCLSVVSAARFKSYREAGWFVEAGKQPGIFLSKPFVGDISKRPLVNLVMPLKNPHGERIGYLGAAIDLTHLTETLLSRTTLPENSVVSLIGSDSVIFARNPDLTRWMGTTVPRDTSDKQPRASKPLFVGRGPDGVERLYAQSWLKHYGLRVGAGVPISSIEAKSAQGLRRSLLAAAGAGLLGLLAAAWVARRLSAPLRSLGDSARALGAGVPGVRADESLPGEFSQLAIEFNRMIDARQAVESSRRAQAEAEAANQAKSNFLAHMSHEIRTPMNAILGLTDLTLRSDLKDDQRRYLAQVQGAATSLLGILNDILDFSKIEAGKLTLEMRDFALDAVLERVRSVVSLKAREKGLRLSVTVGEGVPPVLVGDALRLEQALVNLCGNAVKFTSRGEVAVSVDLRETLPDGRHALRFAVRDTGPGLAPERVPALFTPFTQGDASTTREFGGTGLGLSITRQLIELMGGQIGVHSTPGQGCEFHFTVPLAAGQAEAVRPRASTAASGPGRWGGHDAPAALRGAHILLAEDNELNRIVATDLLTHVGGAQVRIACNGQEAVELATSEPFDLVLMDVQMPVLDGYQATQAIRRVPGLRELPIIAMTAHASQRDREQCLAAGMDGFVTKPFDPAELFSVLNHWVRVGRALHAP